MPEKVTNYARRAETHGVSFPGMFWDSLKPFPGRGRLTLRLAVACTLIVLVAYTFRMPFQDLMPFFVLFITKEEKVTTVITALLVLLAATLAIAVAILIYKSTGNRAEFRIPGIALEIFIGMFLFRVLSIGAVGWILGFISRRLAKPGLPFSQPRGNGPPVSLGGHRVLGRRRLVGQSSTFSRLAHPLASAGIRGRMACCFRRNGTTSHKSAFGGRTIASSAGQTWSDPLSQTFKTFVD